MSVKGEPQAETAARVAAEKAAFLEAFAKRKIVQRALEDTGASRKDVTNWRSTDEAFRIAFEAVEAGVGDAAQEMAMKHAGMLPWTDDEKKNRMWATSNTRMVEVLMRANPRYREGGMNITNNVMALTINGISGNDIKKIVSPDDKRAAFQDAEVVVGPEGKDEDPSAGDIPFVEKKASDFLPSVMAPLAAKRIAAFESRIAERRE